MIPKDLMEKLRYIEIYTRHAVRDHRVGDYRSPIRGRGFEFDQHKRYQHGDDYRQIDWNVTARMRHPYVKKDFEEKEMSAVIMADLSRSMEFASVDQSKRELLLLVAATIAFSAASDSMKVGLLGFTDAIEVNLPLKKGSAQIWNILEALHDVKPVSRKTNFLRPLEYLDRRLKTPTLVFCISDFINVEHAFGSQFLKHLAQKHDFIPLILEDGWDGELPAGKGFLRFHDAEQGETMLFNLSQRKRNLYNTLMKERRVTLERALYRLNLDHLYLHVGESFLDPLLGFFLARKRLR
ncbi:MAG: DUF58 domain-containing protein [Candidatus Binatia bacterium]